MTDNRYVAVEGVIGFGKTSLARLPAERMQAKLIPEGGGEYECGPCRNRWGGVWW